MDIKKLADKIPAEAYDNLQSCISNNSNINSIVRLAHFLSQVSHESGNFKLVEENLRYSANRLRVVFPKYFKTLEEAQRYAMRPVAIGSRVYANRMGNGNEASMEGFKFRGRGYLQLTGKNNYKIFSDYVKEDCVLAPDLVATKYPMDSAFWFFDRNNLWRICDKDDNASVVSLTKRINGGTHGLDSRLSKFRVFMKILNS